MSQLEIKRRKSRLIHVGNVPVGGDSNITVQSMTNTLTTDIEKTLEQTCIDYPSEEDCLVCCN